MKPKEKLEEEVEFWLGYISNWKARHNEPAPDRAQQLLDNALLKLESYFPDKKRVVIFQANNHSIH